MHSRKQESVLDVEARRTDEAQQLRMLVEASSALLGSESVEEILPRLLELARQTLQADAYALWEHTSSTGEWRVAAHAGLSPEYVESATNAIRGTSTEVSLDEPLVVEDIASTDWLSPVHRKAHEREGNESMLAAGLIHREKVLGTLAFYYREAHEFTETERGAASTLANLAAAAFATTRLYEEQAKESEQRRFLAEASALLASSLEYETTLTNVASLAVPRFADWCAIDMVNKDGEIERLAVAHMDPKKQTWADELARGFPPPKADAPYGVPKVLRTRRSELFSEIPDELLVEATRETPELLGILRELGLKSSMCVPLVARDRALGAITFIAAESGRRYDERDLALAEDIARRAAVAVDNALLLRHSEETRALIDALFATAPVGLAFLDRDLRYERINEALAAINGRSVDEHLGRNIHEVLGDQVAGRVRPIYERILATGEPVVDVAISDRLQARPGEERHWVASYYPVRDATAEIIGLGVVVVDVTENREAWRLAEAARERLSVLAEASQALASTLDHEGTLATIGELIVPRYADWYAVDIAGDDGRFHRVALVHRDPAKRALAEHARALYSADPHEPEGAGRVVRTGKPMLYREVPDELLRTSTRDADHYRTLKELGMASAMVVPLTAGGRTFGALMLVSSDPARPYDEEDLEFAQHLGRRAAVAVDNARLYREAQERAHAALVVEHVADGVVLVDREGIIRLWNPAAERIIGMSAADVVGRTAASVFSSWSSIAPLADTAGTRAETRPTEVNGREVWLSITGVAFEGGCVYAFRDLTTERAVDRLKSDFVATVSHELRTPLAAIYGSALTLRRNDVELTESQRTGLLEVIATESDRLARIVNDILFASRIESGTLRTAVERCDVVALARSVLDAAAQYVPPNVELAFSGSPSAPPAAADPDKVRQVIANLVDNAIKYSPDGGTVTLAIHAPEDGRLRVSVRDQGLGIPTGEHERIFEKFYRLDPNLTRGVGGTGLGLYISRELVERMGGRIWVESSEGSGSAFAFDLPLAS
jgi:PAS domain S-box-containing protein